MSISNIGIDPGVTDTGLVGLQIDTITISSTVPAALSKVGIISYPGASASGVASPQSTETGAQPAVITVTDTTSAHPLVIGTDYTLSASGSGSQLTYSVLRISTSSLSSNGDTCTVSYLFGDMPDTAYAIGETFAQSQLAPLGLTQGQQFGAYPGQAPGAADTTGASVAGIGAALPGGSVSDVIPWAGSGNLGGQTGTVSQSDYSALQGAAGLQAPGALSMPLGSPDTEGVYGGGSPLAFAPSLGNESQGNIGSAFDPGIIDTTVSGGSVYTPSPGSSPAYRPPILGVAGSVKDTTLTDILGNQVSAQPFTDAGYNGVNVDTSYIGAPAAPSALSSQTDTFANGQITVPNYLSQAGVITSSIVVTNTTSTQTMVLNTDYTLTVVGNGPDTYAFLTFIVAAHFAVGNTVSATYSYGNPQYYDSNAPASVPAAPGVGAGTLQTDTPISFTATPVPLTKTGIVTPPAGLVVTDLTGGNAGKLQVLNVDYTVTVTGSGSTLTYSIARLAGSTHSTSGDNVSVAYLFGNAAYFTSGPAQPVNRGAQIAWTPPAGTTEVDYYLIQSLPDLGTMYVPKNGQPGFYGQPNVAGSDDYGQPIFQSDTFVLPSALAAPTTPASSTATSGGTVLAGTYQMITSYTNASGETIGSPTHSQITTGSTSTLTVTSPSAEAGATGWYAYVTQAGGSTYTRQQAAGSPTAIGTNLTLTAPPTSTGAAPLTTPQLSKTAVITPPGQLIVRDTTSSALTLQGASSADFGNLTPTGGQLAGPAEQDPLQPMGGVLIYGVDYTVTTIGVGPFTTYQVQLAPGSVNAFPGDTIVVDYWYDQAGTVPLSAANDTLTLVASSAALLHSGIVTAPQSLIVYDTTISKPLTFGTDFTVASAGLGPVKTMTISVITSGPAGAGATDTLHAYYLYGSALAAYFTQGLTENTPLIYKPGGSVYAWQGYQFQIAAGNRLGLGPWSNASDFVVPLNYQAPQPGFQGTTETITFRDPANTINPVYTPSGSVLAGTGLGY